MPPSSQISANDALDRLREGNRRYVADVASKARTDVARRAKVAESQEPFAIILGCSDSRVPAELVFDQGVGDLFVVRIAGNVAAPAAVGSIEFAADNFRTRLVVVLGHTGCGAVRATVDSCERPTALSPGLQGIIDRIRPSVAGSDDPVRSNIRASVKELRTGSQMLGRLIQKEGLVIVGAQYSLETGVVDFLDVC